jgi:SAM-dependent methyltransferase
MTETSALAPPASTVSAARMILRLNTAYFQSKVLQSATELGVFELLAQGPATVAQIRDKLGLQHRLIREFLDALAGLGLLDTDGTSYRNSAAAQELLVPGQPRYLGGAIIQHSRLHYYSWGRLTEALRDGQAKFNSGADGQPVFARNYEDDQRARSLMAHMDAFNGIVADQLAALVDWTGYSSFVDVGGARGNVAARLVRAHPHLEGAVFDLPALGPLFDELMADLATADKVRFHAGDFFADPIPAADVVIIGHVLHDWPAARRRELVARTLPAVRPGGALVIYDAMLDDGHYDAPALLQCLNCSMIREGGSEYAVSECRDYIESAGFTFAEVIPADTITNDRFVIARKR